MILPALFTSHLLRPAEGGGSALDEVDNMRYHTVTAASALLVRGLAPPAWHSRSTGSAPPRTAAASPGLMSFLAALTAQLVVLPADGADLRRRAGRGPASSCLSSGC